MSKVKVQLNRRGVAELLKSQSMKDACKAQADAIAARCGPGYATDTYVGKGRVNASIRPDTAEARRDNLRNNTLLKAMK